jgi:hypothetical protein
MGSTHTKINKEKNVKIKNIHQVHNFDNNKQIRSLQKLMIDPYMTNLKLIKELINIFIQDFDMIIYGEAVMNMYTGIPTNHDHISVA